MFRLSNEADTGSTRAAAVRETSVAFNDGIEGAVSRTETELSAASRVDKGSRAPSTARVRSRLARYPEQLTKNEMVEGRRKCQQRRSTTCRHARSTEKPQEKVSRFASNCLSVKCPCQRARRTNYELRELRERWLCRRRRESGWNTRVRV